MAIGMGKLTQRQRGNGYGLAEFTSWRSCLDVPIVLLDSCSGPPRPRNTPGSIQDSLHQDSSFFGHTPHTSLWQVRRHTVSRGFRFTTETGSRANSRENQQTVEILENLIYQKR